MVNKPEFGYLKHKKGQIDKACFINGCKEKWRQPS